MLLLVQWGTRNNNNSFSPPHPPIKKLMEKKESNSWIGTVLLEIWLTMKIYLCSLKLKKTEFIMFSRIFFSFQ